MLMTATTVKIFIDIFIGVWAFILAVIWCTKIECTGGRIKAGEIWERFPKFVIGYVVTFFIMLIACLAVAEHPENGQGSHRGDGHLPGACSLS